MKTIVVIGLGRFGMALARELTKLGNEVIAIDRNEHKINAIADDVSHAMAADIHDENVLRRMGVSECDCAVVAFAGSIQDSVLVTLLLKELGVRRVIAKACNEMHVRVLQKIGADQIIFPEEDMGLHMARILNSGRLLDYVDLGGEYRIAELRCPTDWVGKSLRNLHLRAEYGFNLLIIKKQGGKGGYISPDADYQPEADDVITVMGKVRQLEAFSEAE